MRSPGRASKLLFSKRPSSILPRDWMAGTGVLQQQRDIGLDSRPTRKKGMGRVAGKMAIPQDLTFLLK